MYLRLNLESQLENLNSLRPLQDLPSFYNKRGFKVIKTIWIHDAEKKLSNNKSLGVNFSISQKKLRVSMEISVVTRKMTGNGMNQNLVNLQCGYASSSSRLHCFRGAL